MDSDSGRRKELFDGIVEELESMPSVLRRIFVLRHYDGHTEQEIAAITGINEHNVSAMLRQAEHMVYHGMHIFALPVDSGF